MDDATKIQHLKNGIKADAGLEHALTTACTNRLAQGDFQSYVTFLLAEVDAKNKRRVQLKSRERQIKAASGKVVVFNMDMEITQIIVKNHRLALCWVKMLMGRR